MIIQLLVENAAKHGISKLKGGGFIKLTVKKIDDYLEICVSNSGKLQITSDSTQLGLKNIKQRLRLLYSTKASFDIFTIKGKKNIKIQVRSSRVTARRGNFPRFRVGKVTYNRKECKRSFFEKGLFDYWFFYSSVTGEYWLIPFEAISQTSEVSMEKFEKWKGGRVV